MANGALASRGDTLGLKLFREVLLASASVPGVFPAVIIAGRDANGGPLQEMHADDGVNTPFVAIPEGMMLWQPLRSETAPGGSTCW